MSRLQFAKWQLTRWQMKPCKEIERRLQYQYYLRGNVKKESIYRHYPHRWVGGQGLFKIFLINLFLTLGGGISLFNNADPTYFR